MSAYFDSSKMPKPENAYILYVDIMGTQQVMTRSFERASNFIFKMHATILQSLREFSSNGIIVYPLMDGAYVTFRNKALLMKLSSSIYYKILELNVKSADYKHWFVLRGGIAHGEIIHGYNVPYSASYEYANSVGYKEKILVGSGMISAYLQDKIAPPMGIALCDNVVNCGDPITDNWKWYKGFSASDKYQAIREFKDRLPEYYEWLEENYPEYPQRKREEHRAKAFEYFEIVK